MASEDGGDEKSSGSFGAGSNFETSKAPENIFKNDGSFLEMFKKAQQSGLSMASASVTPSDSASVTPQEVKQETDTAPMKPAAKEIPKPRYGFVGKRRGGKILPTGKVKKVKQDEEDTGKKDAWSQYMSEVKKYKDQSCQEEGKTRPLVK